LDSANFQAMKTREDYDEDMQVLWHIMEKGAKNNKKSVDVMLVKIRELNNGSFIGGLVQLANKLWEYTVHVLLTI
jgi:hypothetical protein